MPDQHPPRSWLTSEVQTDPLLLNDARRVFQDRGGGVNSALAVRRLLDERLRHMVQWPRALDYTQLADDLADQGYPEEDALLLRCAAAADVLLAEARSRWNTRYDTRPETPAERDTQRLIDVGLIDLDPDGPYPGIDGSRYWPGYTTLETGHQAPVVLIISRGIQELVTGFDDQAAVTRWLHDRGPMASGPLASPDVPVLPRAILEEHVLARLLYPDGDLLRDSTKAPAVTFTADARYDIYAAVTTIVRAGHAPSVEQVSAELSRRMDWVPEWALGDQGAAQAQSYLRRLAVTEPVTFTLQRLISADTEARSWSIRSLAAAPQTCRSQSTSASVRTIRGPGWRPGRKVAFARSAPAGTGPPRRTNSPLLIAVCGHPAEAHARQSVVTSLPKLPDPESVTDESSAADALSSALVAAATANRTLSVASDTGEERGPRHARQGPPPEELEGWLREFHRLLVRIAVRHAEIVSWSVTVGTDFSLTVNFADRKVRAKHDSGFPASGTLST